MRGLEYVWRVTCVRCSKTADFVRPKDLSTEHMVQVVVIGGFGCRSVEDKSMYCLKCLDHIETQREAAEN